MPACNTMTMQTEKIPGAPMNQGGNVNIGSLITGAVIGFFLAGAAFVLVADDVTRLPVIQAIAAAGVLISTSVAALTYALNSQKHSADVEWNRSKLAMESAIKLIERAYEILTVNDKEGAPPNNRYIWLTCARHILAAQEIAKDISEARHSRVYQENLEYWRTRFHSKLSPLGEEGGEMNAAYFAEKPEDAYVTSGKTRLPIAEKSLAVIFRFIRWPKEREDRLQGVESFTDDEIHQFEMFENHGLGQYLSALRKYAKSLKHV